MSTRREFLQNGASLMVASGVVHVTNAALAQSAPNMPARNPWLADGVYPTSHFNPGATDSVVHAGLRPRVGSWFATRT